MRSWMLVLREPMHTQYKEAFIKRRMHYALASGDYQKQCRGTPLGTGAHDTLYLEMIRKCLPSSNPRRTSPGHKPCSRPCLGRATSQGGTASITPYARGASRWSTFRSIMRRPTH